MAQRNGGDQTHWSYFVNPDKSAAPVFDKLCRGLVQVIRRLEAANNPDLSPSRLATFYRACGGNFDELFKNTGDNGISFLYRTLGCYHSLQPTRNAFETPSIPCLTDDGFVRWQTLQLLLYPDEHASLLQQAVRVFDVPKVGTNGLFFPKSIPRECFPSRPDAEMEKWHRFVTSQMNQESYMRRLKFSPYVSPQPESGRNADGYFEKRTPSTSRPTSIKRRTSSEEAAAARREAVRRRSSVPDVLSPGGTNYYEKMDDRGTSKNTRSQSANRPVDYPQREPIRPRSKTGATPSYQYPNQPHGRQQSTSQNRYGSNNSLDRPSPQSPRPQRDRDYSSTSRPSTEEDISSDDSYTHRKHRSSDEDKPRRPRWGSSLMPSFFLSSTKRRHSSDGRVPTLQDNNSRSPNRRKDSIRKIATDGPSPQYFKPSPVQRDERSASGVRFQPNPFNPADPRPVAPVDENGYKPAQPSSLYRYSEPYHTYQPPMSTPNPMPNSNMNGQSPKSNPYYPPSPVNAGMTRVDSMKNFEARKQGLPTRVASVGGMNARRFPPNSAGSDTRAANEPLSNRQRTASMRNMGVSSMV